MKNVYIALAVLVVLLPCIAFGQANINARWVQGNLIYQANDNEMEWLGGIGQNVVVFKEDFNTLNADSTIPASTSQMADWYWFRNDSSQQYYPTIADTTGILKLDYGCADNDSCAILAASEFVYVDTLGTTPLSMKMRFYVGDTTQSEFKFGLMEKNLVVGHGAVNGIYVQKLDGVNEMSLFCSRGGTVDSVVAISNMAVNTWYEVIVYCDGSGGVYGFVNGTALTKITRYTPRTARLTPAILAKTGEASAARKYVYFDDFDVIFLKP